MSRIINGEKYTEFSDIMNDENMVSPSLKAQMEFETELIKAGELKGSKNTDTEVNN